MNVLVLPASVVSLVLRLATGAPTGEPVCKTGTVIQVPPGRTAVFVGAAPKVYRICLCSVMSGTTLNVVGDGVVLDTLPANMFRCVDVEGKRIEVEPLPSNHTARVSYQAICQ
jgi:hypothetical protein